MEDIIKEICRFIIDNIYDDISLERLEKEFYYNKYYIIRMFKEYTGYTIKEFSNTIKVLKTIDPLLYTDDSILKIALNNGFNSQEYYSEKFQDTIGMAPLKFRRWAHEIDHISDSKELKLRKEYLAHLKLQQQALIISNTMQMPNKIRRLEKQ